MISLTASRALETDGSGFIVASAITQLELSRLAGVSSAIQTQLDTKLETTSNVGAGAGIALTKVAQDAPFKSFIGETLKIIVTNNVNDLTFTLGSSVELNTNRDIANGYPSVDANIRLLLARLPIGTAFQRFRTNSGATAIENIDEEIAFAFIVGNGSDVVTTGVKVVLRVEFACEITRWTMLAKESGSMVIDINRYTSLANYDSGTKASITGTDIPTLSSDKGNDSVALTGWTVILNAGDILEAEIDSVTTITRNTLSLRAKKR